MVIAHIYAYMIAEIAVVFIGVEKHKISALKLRHALDFASEIIVALRIGRTRHSIAISLLEHAGSKAGTVKGLGAVSAADIFSSQIGLRNFNHVVYLCLKLFILRHGARHGR